MTQYEKWTILRICKILYFYNCFISKIWMIEHHFQRHTVTIYSKLLQSQVNTIACCNTSSKRSEQACTSSVTQRCWHTQPHTTLFQGQLHQQHHSDHSHHTQQTPLLALQYSFVNHQFVCIVSCLKKVSLISGFRKAAVTSQAYIKYGDRCWW